MADSTNLPVAVLGGGISGLSCAFRLYQLSVPVVLLEASEHIGGLIGTIEKDGFLFETGPQSFQGTDALLDLVRELGLEADLCTADAKAPRFVLRRGKLHKIPMAPQAVLTSSLLSAGSRWKVISDALGRSKPPGEEESVASFVRRKFGHEILEYLVSPFVSGVYAGDPEKLSLRAAFPTLEEWEREYGSVLRGAMKNRPAKGAGSGPPPLCSFQRGNAALGRAIADRLGSAVQAGTQAVTVGRNGNGYQVQVARGGGNESVSARAIVMATPAYVASQVVSGLAAPLAKILSAIVYAPVAVVSLGYHTQQFSAAPAGFGVLIPRSEGIRTLGIVWNSSLFVGRAPKGAATITAFVGGATDPGIANLQEDAIATIAEKDCEKVLGVIGPPITHSVWKYPKALPQYNLGHHHAVEAIRDAERATSGLYFAGNYLEGPSIGKCIELGFQTADAVSSYLKGLNRSQ